MASESSPNTTTKTIDESIAAQDSEVLKNAIKAGEVAIVADNGAAVNVTDGGAFKLVENLIDAVGSWVKEQSNFALSGVNALISSQWTQSQESALTAQENTLSFLKVVAVGVVEGDNNQAVPIPLHTHTLNFGCSTGEMGYGTNQFLNLGGGHVVDASPSGVENASIDVRGKRCLINFIIRAI